MHRDLQTFLNTLERSGELHRVRGEVSPLLQISEVADRHSKSRAASISEAAKAFDPMHCELGGKALLFENVIGCDFPLCINVFGSYRRMEMALGCDDASAGFESIADRIAKLVKPQPPRSIKDMLMKAKQLGGEITYLSEGEIAARNKGYSPYAPETWRTWDYWAHKCGCSHMVSKPPEADKK